MGNIVLGVLIALGIGEIANQFRIRHDIAEARNAIRAELGKNVGQSIERARIAGCVDRKLNALAHIIDAADRNGRLPPLGAIGAPPIWGWSDAVWSRATSDATLANFKSTDLYNLTGALQFIPVMRDYNLRESTIWTRLNVMVGPGRAITPTEIAQLRAHVVEARAISGSMVAVGKTLKRLSEQDNTAYDPAVAAQYAGRTNAQSPICQPIGNNPPTAYGLVPPIGTPKP